MNASMKLMYVASSLCSHCSTFPIAKNPIKKPVVRPWSQPNTLPRKFIATLLLPEIL
jgi:hypothetical protein